MASKKAIWEWKIVRRAVLDALLKLDPRKMMGNPVMFVVEIGSVITSVLLFRGGTEFKFNLQITLWLWFTVLFANFAEAMAEGRGKAQADTLRKAKSETVARRLLADGKVWDLTLAPPARTERAGLKEGIIPVGATVTIHGHRNRDPKRFEVKTERVVWNGHTFNVYPDRK